ncbi:MAG: metal-dependent hydrolase [Saprospiraceae bacterium]|nr:metal-dependent hydrolase [Saprospiraceae bacterium]
MDSVTQAILGASVGHAVLGKKTGNKSAVLGAIVGTIPDLDVVLVPFFNDLQRISIHRGYSHSILFSVLGALLIAWILSRVKWTKEIAFGRLWWFGFLALSTHMLLDAFTTYGTQLFLPLTDYRASFDSITIIDPMYTLPLLTGLLISLFFYKNTSQKTVANYFGLGISSLYLIFTLLNKQQVEAHLKAELAGQGISFDKLLSVPVSAANLVWYGVAKDASGLHIGKYANRQKEPVQFEFFPTNDYLLDELDPYLVDRMKWFSQGFYTLAEHNGKIRLYNMQCDMQGIRYFGNYKAPTAFYFEITPQTGGKYLLSSGMHPKNTQQ